MRMQCGYYEAELAIYEAARAMTWFSMNIDDLFEQSV